MDYFPITNDPMEYTELADIKVRAGVIAHAIRLGKCPTVGQSLGFALQLRTHDVEDADILKIEADSGTPITEKVWCSVRVTQQDIDNARQLINDQAIVYHEPKTSVMKLEKEDTMTET